MRKSSGGTSIAKVGTTTEEDVRAYIIKRKLEGENYSVEHLRRALNIGYKKAKRIFDEMEARMSKGDYSTGSDSQSITPKKRGRKPKKEARSEDEGDIDEDVEEEEEEHNNNDGELDDEEGEEDATTTTSASGGEGVEHSPSLTSEKSDDATKRRSSSRIKRDLGRWTQGLEELKEYERMLAKLSAHPNAWPFNQPVDPVKLNILDYPEIVKNPMDLGTVAQKLSTGEYTGPKQVLADVALVWHNCRLYNPPDNPICLWANELEAYMQKLVAEYEKRRKKEEDSSLKRKAFVYPSPISKKESAPKRKKPDDASDASYPEHQTQEEKWEEKYQQLKDYKRRFGDCKVPKMWEENLSLGTWVHAMRQYKRKGKLSEERTKKLEDIGFVWRINRGDDDEPPPDKTTRSTRVRKRSVDTDFSDDVWEEKFNDLVEFQKRFGHCKVAKKWDEDPELGAWVAHMRERRKQGKLDEDKVSRLDELGFTWNFQAQWENTWEERFEQLRRYKEINGTCVIAKSDLANRVLYQWAHDVRGNRRRGKLSAERINRLDEIGFVWTPVGSLPPPPTGLLGAPAKRKRGRPRKVDVEAALLEANLWGMKVVELEETESDSDTETAEEEDSENEPVANGEIEEQEEVDEEEDGGEDEEGSKEEHAKGQLSTAAEDEEEEEEDDSGEPEQHNVADEAMEGDEGDGNETDGEIEGFEQEYVHENGEKEEEAADEPEEEEEMDEEYGA